MSTLIEYFVDFVRKMASNCTKNAFSGYVLIEFKVANYRSVRAEQTLSMVASNSDELPQNLISCDHVPGLQGTKLVKAVALYGANASGKSNIVAALRFFAEFARDSATNLSPGTPTGTQPFKLDPKCLLEPSKFEIAAVINGIRTLYGLELTPERVTSEYLVAYPKGRPQVWFERDWDEKKGSYQWSRSTASFKHDKAMHEKTRENAAFVGVCAQWNHKRARRIVNWLSEHLDLSNICPEPALGMTARVVLDNPEWRTSLANIVRNADLGIAEGRTRKAREDEVIQEFLQWATSKNREQGGGLSRSFFDDATISGAVEKAVQTLPIPEFLHKGVNGTLVPLDFDREESLGTRRYTALIADILGSIMSEQTIVIDEIETSLHPSLVRTIVSLFSSSAWPGPNTAQMIFTTHNPLLLDQSLLRRDQIWFTEKDQEGATRLYPLTDFKPRKEESLVRGYLAGRYGGIPFIPQALKF